MPSHEKKQLPDLVFMRLALREAEKAAARGEAPVGAIAIASDRRLLGRTHNLRESQNDPLGHAELILLKRLSQRKKGWRLIDTTIYVTLEPCLMCMGALLQARVKRLVYGANDPKGGACGSLYDLSQDRRLNHRIEVTSGVLAEECSWILKEFFKKIRRRGRRKRHATGQVGLLGIRNRAPRLGRPSDRA